MYRAGVLAEVECQKGTAFLFLANHFAHAFRCIQVVSKLQHKVILFIAL